MHDIDFLMLDPFKSFENEEVNVITDFVFFYIVVYSRIEAYGKKIFVVMTKSIKWHYQIVRLSKA